jgi:hypothetical protein
MLLDPSSRPARRRPTLALAAALAAAVLVLGLCSGAASAAAAAPEQAQEPVTTTTSRPVPSTSAPQRDGEPGSSGWMLPMVLAAIIFLALLGPTSWSHSHGHWHSG